MCIQKRTASGTRFTFSFLFREEVNPDFTVLLGFTCIAGLCSLGLMLNVFTKIHFYFCSMSSRYLGLHHLSSISSLQFSATDVLLINECVMEALKNLPFHHEEVRPEIVCAFLSVYLRSFATWRFYFP